jgi:site-specific DNA-methyltransferase (adenine-specific)
MIICGDCLEEMAKMEPNSIDSIVTDPPYGLSFMGKDWDHGIPGVHFWSEALRVTKPGCHLLAFGGTRTFHRLACAIEDAGWEIRDCLGWLYGSGFPKSHNLKGDHEGWGTALKPAWEPIIMARKPLEGTVAANVLKWGTGAINVDGCRIPSGGNVANTSPSHRTPQDGWDRPWRHDSGASARTYAAKVEGNRKAVEQGRWPANLLHDGSDEVMELFPQTGVSSGGRIGCKDTGTTAVYTAKNSGLVGKYTKGNPGFFDSGSAARFFYCAKASRKEREMGCEGMEERTLSTMSGGEFKPDSSGGNHNTAGNPNHHVARNNHPTVKPLALMRYLCRLVTPPGGLILDPFMGSGTTGIAAKQEDFNFTGIDISQEYCDIAGNRIKTAKSERLIELVRNA